MDDLKLNDLSWHTLIGIAFFFTITKTTLEKGNMMTEAPLYRQLKMITKISPVLIFFRAGCLYSTIIAAGVVIDGFGDNSGFFVSIPQVL